MLALVTTPPVDQVQSLPALIDRASSALASAKTAAEVMEAMVVAAFAYDAADIAARMARLKKAGDELLATAYRAQADALEIEAQAKRRLAEAYDAAQQNGEVARHGGARGNQHTGGKVPIGNVASLGLSRKLIHEGRAIAAAEAASPGIVRQTLDAQVAARVRPTRAAVRTTMAQQKRKAVASSTAKELYTPQRWRPPAEVVAMVEALRDDPKAFRDLLRGMLDFESHYTVADHLFGVFSHRRWFAQDVANHLLDLALWAEGMERPAAPAEPATTSTE